MHVDKAGTILDFAHMQEIANDIIQEQSPKRIFQVRGKLYELLVNCLPPTLILRKLALELVRKLDEEVQHTVLALAAAYEHRMQVNVDIALGVTLIMPGCA